VLVSVLVQHFYFRIEDTKAHHLECVSDQLAVETKTKSNRRLLPGYGDLELRLERTLDIFSKDLPSIRLAWRTGRV
jgi:hypothetical protein